MQDLNLAGKSLAQSTVHISTTAGTEPHAQSRKQQRTKESIWTHTGSINTVINPPELSNRPVNHVLNRPRIRNIHPDPHRLIAWIRRQSLALLGSSGGSVPVHVAEQNPFRTRFREREARLLADPARGLAMFALADSCGYSCGLDVLR